MRRAGLVTGPILLLATAAFFWRPAPRPIDGEATASVALDAAGRTTERVVARDREGAEAALVIPEGTRVSFPRGVPPVVSVTVVDQSPWALPEGVSPGLLVSFEPTGTRFEPGVSIAFPNPTGLPEGTRCPLWGSDERIGGYLAVGTATVNAEGVFESDGPIVTHFSTYFVELPFRVDTVGGNVLDDGTGAGIAGATVSVLGLSTTSGAAGEFLFDQLVPRTGWAVRLVVTATIGGSVVTVTSADIIPPKTDVVIRLATPATVTGTIALFGALTDVRVSAFGVAGTVAPDGSFRIPGVPVASGVQTVSAVASARRVADGRTVEGTSAPVALAAGATIDVGTVTLDREGLQPDPVASLVLGRSSFAGVGDARNLQLPRGMASDGTRFAVADTVANRVLIWNSIPSTTYEPADLVVGQPDFHVNRANRGGPVAADTLAKPSGVVLTSTALVVADMNNHRVLIYDRPWATDTLPEVVLGGLAFPADVSWDGARLFVSERGASRVSVFEAPDLLALTGQETPVAVLGEGLLLEPEGIHATAAGRLFVADNFHSRVLAWDAPYATGAAPALVLGQSDLSLTAPGTGAARMAYPRGVFFTGQELIVADTGNHRTLIFEAPLASGMSARNVLGQNDLAGNLSNRAGPDRPDGIGDAPLRGDLAFPHGVLVAGGQLFITDQGNNRIAVHAGVPATNYPSPDFILGQSELDNHDFPLTAGGGRQGHSILFRVTTDGQRLVTADPYYSRVLVWNTLPTDSNEPADLVLGQAGFFQTQYNKVGLADPNRSPDATTLASSWNAHAANDTLWVADTGNHRVLAWRPFPTTNDEPADLVLGQPNMTSGGPAELDKPTGVWTSGGIVFVADNNHHRVVIYEDPFATDTVADAVLGQGALVNPLEVYASPTLVAVVEGGSHRVVLYKYSTPVTTARGFETPDRVVVLSGLFLGPASVTVEGERLAVVDTGNNRVLVWDSIPTLDGQSPDRVLGSAFDHWRNEVGPDRLRNPKGAVLKDGALWVADTYWNRILRFDFGASEPAPPRILHLTTPGGRSVAGTVTLQYRASAAVPVSLVYSLDGGLSYLPASFSEPAPGTVLWDSLADLGPAAHGEVYLKLVPAGGTGMVTGAFAVDNRALAVPATLRVRTVSAVRNTVSQGQTGVALAVTVENTGQNAADVGAVTPRFRAGAVDVSPDYTLGPSAGNPIQIAAGSTASFGFTVGVSAAATRGLVTIDAGATGTDALTGAATADPEADIPDAWTVQGPPALSVTLAPSFLVGSVGQAVTLTVTVTNSGEATALGVTPAGPTAVGPASLVSGAPPTPRTLAGGASAAFIFGYTLGPTAGSVTWTASASGADANTGLAVSAPQAASQAVTVQTPPALVIEEVATLPTTVSRGQTGIAVSVRARNAGQAAANITGVLVLFRRDHIPRDPDYTQRPFGTNPAQIPGGATASLGVVVDVSPLASIGPVTLDARLAATDAHSGVDATVEGAQQTDTWTVQTPAQLRLDEVTAQAVVVAPGQSGVPVTLTVTNAGEAAARITAAALVFRASPSSYTATRTDTVTSLAGGATATLSFAVDVAATTPAGTETLDAAVTAADVHSGQDASDPHADATASWLVASPGSATAFRIEFIPGDPGAGIPVGSFHDILLTAITPSGEVATDYVGNVLLASSDTQAFFHGTEVAFSRADAGVRRLPDLGVFRSPGSHTVTATDLVFPALTATVLAQVVTAPVRMSLLSGGRNELVSVGRKPTPVTVQVFDGFDQPVQGAVVRVVLDGVGALSVTTTATGTARLDLPQPFMVGTVQATVSLPDHPQIPAVTYTIEVRRVEILAELTPDGTLRLTVDGQLHPDVDAVTVAGQATVRVPGTNTFVLTSPPLAEGKGILDVKITRSDGSVLERVVDVVKDTAPPIARLLSPFDGAVELPLPAAFVVEFGERISPFSVTPDTFSLAAEGGVPVLGDLEFSATGTTVVFMPTQPLPPAASLQLLLTSGIEDLAGNALAPANFRFTSATTDPPQAPPPGTGQAIHLTPVDGGGQFDETVNRPAHRPIVMFASDQDGRPLNGIPLRFEVYRGNATFFESDGLTAITGAAGPGLGGLNLLFGSEVGEVRVRVEAAHGSAQASDEVFLAARNPHFDMGLGNDPTARAGEIVGHLNLLLCEPRCGSGIANASVEFLSTGDPNDPDIEIFPNPATTDRAGRIEAILIGRRPGTHAVTIRFPDFPAAELRQFALLDRLLGPRTIRVDVSGEPPFLGAPVPLISNRNEDWDRNLVTVLRLVRRASLTTLSPPVQVATGVTPVTFSVQVLNDFGHPVIGREEFQVLLDSVEAQLLRVAAPLRTEEVDQDVPGTFRTFGLSDPLMLNLELFTFAGEPGRANVQPAPESLPTEAERLFAPPETAFRRMVRTDGAGRLVASATPVEPLRRPMEVAFHSHPENLTAEGVVLLETGGFQTNLNAFGSFLRDLVIPRFQAAVDEAHRGLPGGSGLIFRMVPRYLQLTGTGPSPDETAIHEVMAQDVSRFAPEGPIPDEAFWLNYFDAPGTAAEAFTVEISGIDREGAIFEADGRFPEPAVRVDLERVDETTRHTHFRSVRPVLALQNSTSEAIPTDQLRVYPLRSLAGGTIDAALPSAGPPTTPGRWPVRVAAPSADVLLSARSLDEDDLVVVEAIAPAGLGGVNYQYFGPDGVRRTRWAAETVEEFFTPMAERVAVCQDLLSVRGRTRPGEILSVELDDPLVSAAGASGDAMRIDAIDVDFVDAVDGLPIATLPLTSLLNGPAEPRDEAGRPIPVYSFALTVEGSQISRLLLVSYAIDKETVIDSEVVDAFAPVRLVIEETLPGDGLLRGVFGGLVEASHPDGTPFEEAAPPVPGEGGLVEFPDGGAPQLFGSYLGIMVKRTDIGEQKRIGNFRIPDPHDPARGIDVYMEVLSLRTRRGQMGDRMIEVIDLNPYKIIDPNVRVLAKVTEKGKLERFRSPFISEDDERWINAYVEQNSEPFFDLSDETKFQLALIFHTFGGDLDTAREIAERIRNGEREVDVLGGTVSREAFFGAIGGALGQIGKRAGRLALQKFNATVDRFYGSFRGKWSPGASPVGHTAERLATSATETLDDHVARHAQEFDELAPSLRGLKKSAEKPRTIPGRRPTFVELESDGTLPPGVVNEQRQLVTQEYLEIALSYLNHRRSDPSKHIQVFEFEKAGVRMRHVFDLDKAVFASGNVTTGEVATCFRPAPRALTDAGVPVTEIPVQFLRLETKVYMKKQELELAKYGYLEIR